MEKNTNYDMCKKCGGACCKETGCMYVVNDFRPFNFRIIKSALDSGKISIGGQPIELGINLWSIVLYLRARNTDSDVVDIITKGGPCVMLSDTGCLYSESERPSLGLYIKPTKIGGPCNIHNGEKYIIEWLNNYSLLQNLVRHYTDKEVYDVFQEQLDERMAVINDKKSLSIQLTPMENLIDEWNSQIIVPKEYIAPQKIKSILRRY